MKHIVISEQEMQRLDNAYRYIGHFSVQQVEQGYEVTYERQKLGIFSEKEIHTSIGYHIGNRGKKPKILGLMNNFLTERLSANPTKIRERIKHSPRDLDGAYQYSFQLTAEKAESTMNQEAILNQLPTGGTIQEILQKIPTIQRYPFEVILCVAASPKEVDNPTWLIILRSPSVGKTYLLKHLKHPKITVFVDDFTENSLAAGRPNTDASPVKNLLEEANGKNLIMNDMSSILSQRSDKVRKLLGALTTAYGGHFAKHSPGSGVQEYRCFITLIMAMTNDTYRTHRNYMAMLGSRFLVLRLKRPEGSYNPLSTEEEKALSKEVCGIVYDALKGKVPDIPTELELTLKIFTAQSVILRSLASAESKDEIEGESRLYQQLTWVIRSRANLHRREVIAEDIEFVKPLVYPTILFPST